ncbi:MAG: rhodanese-like domain-containing protein [Flavobacteriaceae bacterium]|nr:rhodanese-like domain-containing protein [Flavobacteriaceae bacterium]
MSLFNLFRSFGNKDNMIKEYLKKEAVVLDVRTPAEFDEGHVNGSINIPLHVLQARMHEIKDMNKPVIAVCRSGARSGQATGFLKQQGFDIINGGPWQNVAAVLK